MYDRIVYGTLWDAYIIAENKERNREKQVCDYREVPMVPNINMVININIITDNNTAIDKALGLMQSLLNSYSV